MPGATAPAFSLTTTFAPQRRQTLAAFMAVNSAPGPNYGQIQVLQLPSNTTIPGPQQVQNNFESDPNVSAQLTLLRRGGAELEFGNLLSLPFNGGLLYVEPVYLRAAADGYPLLRKVLVGYGSSVTLDDTLEGALERVFSISPSAIPEPTFDPDTGEPLEESIPPAPLPDTDVSTGDPALDLSLAIADAQSAYEAGLEALKRGDFSAYDRAQKQLAAALRRAADAQALLTGGAAEPPPDDATT